MKMNAKYELLKARADFDIEPFMNNSQQLHPPTPLKMNYLVLCVLRKEMLYALSLEIQVVERC